MYTYFYVIIILLALIYILIPKNLFLNTNKNPHQNFATNYIPPLLGGYFLILALFFNPQVNLTQKILYLLIFFSGTLSDFKILNSPTFRLFFQTAIILIFVKLTNIYLEDTRIILLDQFLNNDLFNIFFCTFCIVILVNLSNFIDGLNGIVSGYYIIILIALVSIGTFSSIADQNFIQFTIFVLFLMLILNLFNKIYIGDSGSYLLGFFIATILIKTYVENPFLSPYFIILLIWYPCFENLFSIIRKLKTNMSPLKPDNLHLHQLIFKFFCDNFNFKKNFINNLSSLIILSYNLIIILISLTDVINSKFQILLIIINIITYLCIYLFLLKKNKLIKK